MLHKRSSPFQQLQQRKRYSNVMHALLCLLCLLCAVTHCTALSRPGDRIDALVAEALGKVQPGGYISTPDEGPASEILGPVPPELQALLESYEAFDAVGDDNVTAVGVHGTGGRALLHGGHGAARQQVCPRCRSVRCYSEKGTCTGHCRKRGRIFFCARRIDGPPPPDDVPDVPPGVDQVDLPNILVHVTAEEPFVGCSSGLNGDLQGCDRPEGFFSAVDGLLPESAQCKTGGAELPMRWYDTNDDYNFIQAGVCECTYVNDAGDVITEACETDRKPPKLDSDESVSDVYQYPMQTIAVGTKSVKVSVSDGVDQSGDDVGDGEVGEEVKSGTKGNKKGGKKGRGRVVVKKTTTVKKKTIRKNKKRKVVNKKKVVKKKTVTRGKNKKTVKKNSTVTKKRKVVRKP